MATHRQRKRLHARRAQASRPRTRRCLFCLREDQAFRSREHIISETLGGSNEKVLKPGVVCDRCNNGPLSVLDRELQDFLPIAMMRTVLGIRNKQGRLPIARFADAVIERHEGDLLKIQTSHDRVWTRRGLNTKVNLTGKRMTKKYVATLVRGLYKITLEFIYFDHGRELAFSGRFDEIREIVLGTRAFHGYLLILRTGKPSPQSHFTYEFVQVDGIDTVMITADIYGTQMATDLEIRSLKHPELAPPELCNLLEF